MKNKGDLMNQQLIHPIRHGLMMGIAALIFGALWAAYMATHHEQLHGAFEMQQQEMLSAQVSIDDMGMDDMGMGNMDMGHAHENDMADNHHGHGQAQAAQHSHSGSLATDAMQRLLRGHIHAMKRIGSEGWV
jgi:hypothetical protein